MDAQSINIPRVPHASTIKIPEVLQGVAESYPAHLRASQLADLPRIAWHLSIVQQYCPAGGSVLDVGGGIGLFSPGAAALGYRSMLLDDFGDTVNAANPIAELNVHGNVKVYCTDGTAAVGLFPPKSLDAVTSFESIEHWTKSPKTLFHALKTSLKDGGLFFLGVPNCVDLRTRMSVPLGKGKWSSMAEWYEKPVFRGHVREFDVDDLRYIAQDLGLRECKIVGRNWQGYISKRRWLRAVVPFVDKPVQAFPSLCSDIYVIGKK